MFRGSPLRSVQHAGCGTPARSGGQLRLERLLRAAQGVELLSERELGVIRLLGTDLDGPDIARQLVVSLNTVGTHTKNIYAKLGVNNRRAAVRRAQELDLLSRNPAIRRRSRRTQPLGRLEEVAELVEIGGHRIAYPTGGQWGEQSQRPATG